jgi:hypothetical protein
METLKTMRKNQWKTVEIKEDVEIAYNKKIQKQLSKTVWQIGGCKSWYQTESGINTTLYPTYSFVFRKATSKFKKKEHFVT